MPLVKYTTRFAPSPTGYLHLGHAFAALYAHDRAHASGGEFLLRIEDIDRSRARAEFEQAIFEDLAWLGLRWSTPVRRQSEHFDEYQRALDTLHAKGCLYPCFCTRKEIAAELAASAGAPQGPDGPIYHGTCRSLADSVREDKIRTGVAFAWRLNVQRALRLAKDRLQFEELGEGPDGENGLISAMPERLGDVVLARKDVPTSYHLAVVVDDHLQGVNLVTRGDDLFQAAHLHRLLQSLLGYPAPRYSHHRLLLDEQGKRLAKRDDATSLRLLRAQGVGPQQIREKLDFTSR